jgi:chromosomal replication initiator protein
MGAPVVNDVDARSGLVLLAVEEVTKTPVEALLGRGRWSDYVESRYLAAYVLRTGLGLSYPAIGRVLNRSHSTVIHGIRKITREIRTSVILSETVEAIRDEWKQLAEEVDE